MNSLGMLSTSLIRKLISTQTTRTEILEQIMMEISGQYLGRQEFLVDVCCVNGADVSCVNIIVNARNNCITIKSDDEDTEVRVPLEALAKGLYDLEQKDKLKRS